MTENNSWDFPFYNNNPRIPKLGWLILFLSLIVGVLVSAFVSLYSETLSNIVWPVIVIIPLLYYSKWDYHTLIHKPDLNELFIAGLMFSCYIVYAVVMMLILDFAGLSGTGTVVNESTINNMMLFNLIFSIITEELIKFIPLMFFMGFFYKYSERKDVSFIFASIIVMVGFGLLHYSGDVTLYSVLLIQGLGTVFELYGYAKTKNLIVPYLSHLFTDEFLLLITLLI